MLFSGIPLVLFDRLVGRTYLAVSLVYYRLQHVRGHMDRM